MYGIVPRRVLFFAELALLQDHQKAPVVPGPPSHRVSLLKSHVCICLPWMDDFRLHLLYSLYFGIFSGLIELVYRSRRFGGTPSTGWAIYSRWVTFLQVPCLIPRRPRF